MKSPGECEMVAIAEGIEIRAITAEERHTPGDFIDLVEIEREHENPVTKVVLLRRQPMVHDAALIEARVHDQIGSPVIARAHSRALVKPSSWKPYLNHAPA